jgi:hypothetical protein
MTQPRVEAVRIDVAEDPLRDRPHRVSAVRTNPEVRFHAR